MIAYTNTSSFVSDAIQRAAFIAVSFVENAVTAVIRNRRYTNTVSQLNALDDRMLEDIGLGRTDIRSAAKYLSR